VPWCASCSRYPSPSTVRADGTCPECGRAVDPGAARVTADTTPDGAADEHEDPLPPLPWHFKALVGAVVLYLGYRAYQGVEWLVGRI